MSILCQKVTTIFLECYVLDLVSFSIDNLYFSTQICEEVNRHCLDVLTSYVDEYKTLAQDTQGFITFYVAGIDHVFSRPDQIIYHSTKEIRQLLKQLRDKYEMHKSKNIELLINVEQARIEFPLMHIIVALILALS